MSSQFRQKDALLIHHALHDTKQTEIEYDGVSYGILNKRRTNLRYVSINRTEFVQQNLEKKTKYAELARNVY